MDKLRDRLLSRVPKDELKAVDNLRDACLLDERADAVRAKLAELYLSSKTFLTLLARFESQRATHLRSGWGR